MTIGESSVSNSTILLPPFILSKPSLGDDENLKEMHISSLFYEDSTLWTGTSDGWIWVFVSSWQITSFRYIILYGVASTCSDSSPYSLHRSLLLFSFYFSLLSDIQQALDSVQTLLPRETSIDPSDNSVTFPRRKKLSWLVRHLISTHIFWYFRRNWVVKFSRRLEQAVHCSHR